MKEIRSEIEKSILIPKEQKVMEEETMDTETSES